MVKRILSDLVLKQIWLTREPSKDNSRTRPKIGAYNPSEHPIRRPIGRIIRRAPLQFLKNANFEMIRHFINFPPTRIISP